MRIEVRDAVAADAPAVTALVRRAYRGDDSRNGWTTEADLLDDERITESDVLGKITGAGSLVLVVGEPPTACCEVADRGDGLSYFGMFAVRPDLQAAGLGRQLLAQAEAVAASRWHADAMEMTVIGQREELIAWYERRGYRRTGERRPFPYAQLVNGTALRDDLYFEVLRKDLPAP